MADLTEGFDLPNGTTFTTANTAFSNVALSGGAAVADTSVVKEGTAALHLSGTGSAIFASIFASAVTTRHFGFWIRPTDSPSANNVILYTRNGADTSFAWDVRVTTARLVQLRNSSLAQVAVSVAALPTGEWSYISVGAVNGTLTARLWIGDAASTAGGTPTETLTGSYATTDMGRAAFGSTTNGTWDVRYDTYKGRDAGPILLAATGTAPVNTAAPVVSGDGTPQIDETLTCSAGTWTGSATITYAYQWRRDGANIAGATASTYTLTAPDVAKSITCAVTATNTAGSASQVSNAVVPTGATATDLTEGFDLPNGTVPTSANTGFNNVSITGMSAAADTSIVKEGTAALHVTGTGSAFFSRIFAALTTRHSAFWIRPSSLPSVDTAILYARNEADTGFAWEVRVTTAGLVRLRDSSLAQVAITAAALPLNQWSYVSVGAVNGTLTARLWLGDTASTNGGTPTETISGAYATTSMGRIVFGVTNTVTWDTRFDTYKGRAAGPILLTAATAPPVNTVAPTISGDGTPVTGEVLTSTLGTWTGTPTPTLTRQWKLDGAPISGATGATYTPTQVAIYRCDVTATNTDPGSPVTAQSNPLTVTAAPVVLAGDPATQADTATIKVTDPTNGTAPFTHVITQLSGPATTARAVGTTGRWWAVERQASATTWRVTTTDAAGSTALVRDVTVQPAGTATAMTGFFGTSTGWVGPV